MGERTGLLLAAVVFLLVLIVAFMAVQLYTIHAPRGPGRPYREGYRVGDVERDPGETSGVMPSIDFESAADYRRAGWLERGWPHAQAAVDRRSRLVLAAGSTA
jgi:hypothetical protein